MAKRSFVQVNGVLYERGVDQIPEEQEKGGFPTIVGDIEPFVSVVDGSVISSRRALREHNARNDVVLTADLKGLPVKKAVEEYKVSKEDRERTREFIAYQVGEKLRR
jgi:hypothetical protein